MNLANELIIDEDSSADRIAEVAQMFLEECVNKRALGVALTVHGVRRSFREFHIIGLLQTLPSYFEFLGTRSETLVLVKLIQRVLSNAPQEVGVFLGVKLQARFCTHLLGLDPETFDLRAKEVANCVFLLDSHNIIPLLARSSVGNPAAQLLLDQLEKVGAKSFTTERLAWEVATHARFARRNCHVNEDGLSEQTYASAKGVSGFRNNAFLEGFISELEGGLAPLDFDKYLDSVFESRDGHKLEDKDIFNRISELKVECKKFEDWEWKDSKNFAERDEFRERITRVRVENGSFKTDDQCIAEAEVVMIIKQLRSGQIGFGEEKTRPAFFVSDSRILDRLEGSGTRITMRPDSVLQWLTTLAPVSEEGLAALYNGLLWELSERGLTVVNFERLRTVFEPLLDASKVRLEEELEVHRDLIGEMYGEDQLRAFSEVNYFEAPVVVHELLKKENDFLLGAIKELKREKKLSDRDKQRLSIFETKQAQKRQRVKNIAKTGKRKKSKK